MSMQLSILCEYCSVSFWLLTLIFLSIYLYFFRPHVYLQLRYAYRLNVPDLKPNIGLFWYFFTEMFEHFRPLFLCSFQINATLLYLTALSIRLRNEPILLAGTLTALNAIFKSYPSIGDVGFYIALLPMWKHLFQCKCKNESKHSHLSRSAFSNI